MSRKFCFLLFILFISVICIVFFPFDKVTDVTENGVIDFGITQADIKNNAHEAEEDKVMFVLKEYDGKIAVFDGINSNPVIVYNIFVNTLPDYDQNALERGIEAYDIKELNRLIEDYTS